MHITLYKNNSAHVTLSSSEPSVDSIESGRFSVALPRQT